MIKARHIDYKLMAHYRIFVLLYSLCFFYSSLYAQFQTQPIKPDVSVKMVLKKETSELLPTFKFNKVTILDARADTSCLGFAPGNKPKIYILKNGFITELTNWYNRYLDISPDNPGTLSLVVNIKKLRISDEAIPKIMGNGSIGQPHNGWEKGVIIKVEYFLQKDSFFIPVYRYDSIIPLKGGVERYGEEFISIGLKTSLEKLCNIKNDQLIAAGKRISFDDIQRSNKQGYDLPVYSNTELKKGVYKSFLDFKMNIISWTEFQFKEGKMADLIYIKENGTEFPLRSAWGYCDGENYFINSGDKYSKLIRSGFNFYFEGIKGVNQGSKHMMMYSSGLNFATDTGPKKTVISVDENYYQLDMENGNVY